MKTVAIKVFTSSPPNRTASWTHGERDSMKIASRLKQKRDVSLKEPNPNELRDCLREGFCWWCDRGGFKSVANHTSHAHGISAMDIRNLTELTFGESIATPEYSEFCKTRPQNIHCEKLLASEKNHKQPRYTIEGLRRKRESVKIPQFVFRSLGIIPNPTGNPEALKKARTIHLDRLKNASAYYKKWRIALSSTGRDKRIISNCPICHKPFKHYETSNRKTCGNPECSHILRSSITRFNNLQRKLNQEVFSKRNEVVIDA